MNTIRESNHQPFVDFSSRISARAIIAGTLVTFASLFLFLTVIAGIGLWDYQIRAIGTLGTGFWVLSGISWLISMGLGAYTAGLVGRSNVPLDGRLHGVVTWAASCLVGALFVGLATGRYFDFAIRQPGRGLFWMAFVGNLLSLIVAVLSGAASVRAGARVVTTEEREVPIRTRAA